MASELPPTRAGLRQRGLLAWLHMLRITRRTERAAAQHLQQWQLSYAQFDLLAQVGAAEGISQQELAQRLLVTQGNITQLLDKLEQRGLVRRCPQGRSNLLQLTNEGRRLYAIVVPAHEAWQAQRFAALTPDEQTVLLRLLAKVDRGQRQ